MTQPHLVVDISAHGLGHLAQVAPVLELLAQRLPRLRLTVRSALPREQLARRLAMPFTHVAVSHGVGAVMAHALTVERAATRAALLRLHEGWEERVRSEAQALARLAPTVVLANVPYLSLAAARRAGIPALALCSLNWADIYDALFPGDAELRAPLDAMRQAYSGADAFLRPCPSMPMAWLGNAVDIGPIAARGRARRGELCRLLGVAPDTRLALVSLGGVAHPPLAGRGEAPDHWHFIEAKGRGAAVTDLERLTLPFHDVLASVDALITKPGYGLFVEAAAAAKPVLYLPRGDWAEEPVLVDWLRQVGCAEPLVAAELEGSLLAARLDALLVRPAKPPVAATGAAQAAQLLAPYLGAAQHPLATHCQPS